MKDALPISRKVYETLHMIIQSFAGRMLRKVRYLVVCSDVIGD